MSTLEMILQRGKKEGKIEEQIRAIRGLLKAGTTVKLIATALEVSIKYVQKIKDEMIENGELPE
jgi:predicted transposase YdaD